MENIFNKVKGFITSLGEGGFVGFVVLIILWMLLDNGSKK